MNPDPALEQSLLHSYLTLRKLVGLLGTAFPFLLSIGAWIVFHTGLQASMSGYYYTGMRDVFVAVLCVIGFFLLFYRGNERKDDIAGDLACVFAVGVALFPTAPEYPTPHERWIGSVHLAFAALFFSTLTYFSLFLFTKTSPHRLPTRRKSQRNRVYRVCGCTMATCIVSMFALALLHGTVEPAVQAYRLVYWLEAIAVVAFGISWLTKGEAILKDPVEGASPTR